MDFDLEIINEEADYPDPLFDSIMNAMNSMKEATADKIYQKIQREGETNYSKPQVDRALECALKYGIFEIRNNRYRVRDDILDDEDTVYWKLQKKKEKTPFRIQEDTNEKQFGPKLDPERDNQRFKRMVNEESQECPHCGRTKRPVLEEEKLKNRKKAGVHKTSKKKRKPLKKEQKTSDIPKRKMELKRRERSDLNSDERYAKRRKPSGTKQNEHQDSEDKQYYISKKLMDRIKKERKKSCERGPHDSKYSEINLISTSEHCSDTCLDENKNKHRKRSTDSPSLYSSESVTLDYDIFNAKRSSISIKSESDSEKSDISSGSDDQSQNRTGDAFFENLSCTLRNANGKARNQYLSSSEMYNNQYESSPADNCKGTSEWLGCSNEPQGAIIQSDNVLTIEPMDSLAFKSPEQASYIS